MALEIGSRLGHYDVTALIGEGGMGQVYQATDTNLDRQVAIKALPDAFAGDADRLARFEREAKVLASLNHPNIGAIYGLEKSGDTRALVLELVEGPTLADRIAQGPIPVDEALPIAKQIAEALEAAHEQGVIHRDLKPADIKVKDDGMVKVLDFGLAKAFEPEAGSVSASMSPTISLTAAATRMGMVIGTAAYMAPEQAKGKVVDKRADMWAFGAVLYEMVAGTDGNVREPFFSPDGQSIGFYSPASNQLQKVFTSGGAPVALGDAQNPWGASWDADDMILYGQGQEGIWRVPGTGGTPEQVITVEDGEQAHGPQMLPGDWVLFTFRPAGVTSWDTAHIVMQSLTTDERVVLIEGGRDARYVETGHLVYALNGVVTATAFDLDAREVIGGPVPLVEGVRDAGVGTGAVQFSVAGNGSLFYVPEGHKWWG